MNRQMLEQMMARLQGGTMLPPPNADYAPGGSMFPGQSMKIPGQDPNAPPIPEGSAKTMLGKAAQLIAPGTSAVMAGKGGAG